MSEAFDNEPAEQSGRAGRVARMKAERPAANKKTSKKVKKRSNKESNKRVAKKAASAGSDTGTEFFAQPWRGVVLGAVLLAVCVGFGVQSASQSQRIRTLYSQLQQDALAKDALLAQQSRLLIERGALQSFNSVDRLAEDKLKMRFPESITRVTREGGN